MKVSKMAAAVGYIDDDLVTEAVDFKISSIHISILWMRRVAVICLCVLLLIPLGGILYMASFAARGVDPYEKTHLFRTSELEEIEAICGSDLLLDRITVSGSRSALYRLELTKEGTNFHDPAHWKYLFIEVKNGDSVFDINWDNFACYILFDGSELGSELVSLGMTTVDDFEDIAVATINGYTVEYAQVWSGETPELQEAYTPYGGSYHGWAKFVHKGYTYFITVHSNDPDYLVEVLEQLLG